MMKNIIAASLIGAMLLFSGCGEESGAVDTLETQQMLDDQNYDGVIAKIDGSLDVNRTYEENMALGAAYMGKSGFALVEVIKMIITSDSNDTNASSDPFANLSQNIGENRNPNTIENLKKARLYYEQIVDCNEENLTVSERDVCFNVGIANTVTAVTTISYLADDLASAFEAISGDANASTVNDGLIASSCAMDYAFNGSVTIPECVVRENQSDVTFSNGAVYTPFEIKMSDTNNTYDYLLTPATVVDANTSYRQTALTDGYCSDQNFTRYDINITSRNDVNTSTQPIYPLNNVAYDVNNTLISGVYPCPVNEGNVTEELTAADLLVDVLNGGLDAVIASTGDPDMAAQIDDFKFEILGVDTTNMTDQEKADYNTTITLDAIISYLNGGV